MLSSLRQTHLEYVAKVLGVKSVVRTKVPLAPANIDLLVVAPRADADAFSELLGRVIAAWELRDQQVHLQLTDDLKFPEKLEHESRFVLAFFPQAERATQGWIFAGRLGELDSDQNLKRNLWRQIQAAKVSLGEGVV